MFCIHLRAKENAERRVSEIRSQSEEEKQNLKKQYSSNLSVSKMHPIYTCPGFWSWGSCCWMHFLCTFFKCGFNILSFGMFVVVVAGGGVCVCMRAFVCVSVCVCMCVSVCVCVCVCVFCIATIGCVKGVEKWDGHRLLCWWLWPNKAKVRMVFAIHTCTSSGHLSKHSQLVKRKAKVGTVFTVHSSTSS